MWREEKAEPGYDPSKPTLRPLYPQRKSLELGLAPLSNEKVRVKSIYWQCLLKSDAVCAMTG